LQRHLTAFEADLVGAAFTGALTFDAAAASLALTSGRAAANTQTGLLAARSGSDVVQTHFCTSK
jgi:hypothetical protein